MVEKGRIESTLETAWEDRGLKEPTSACDSNYIDDLTMFMAWHNWCLHEQNRVLSQILHNQYQKITNLQNDTDQQLRNTTTFNNVLRNESTRRVGITARVAPLRKRLAAEVIDFFILLLVKMFVITYCLGEQYIDKYVLIIDENTTIEDLQATLIQALLLRLVAVAYEGYCISGALPLSNGSTLGKKIMGLHVIRCEIIENIDAIQETILVIPGNHVGTFRSLLRAAMKNAIISLFFPMLLPFHTIANHNQLIYDVASGTIVVEKL